MTGPVYMQRKKKLTARKSTNQDEKTRERCRCEERGERAVMVLMLTIGYREGERKRKCVGSRAFCREG